LALCLGATLVAAPALAAPAYTLTKSTPLGAPDRWDYVVYNGGRVYVAQGDKVAVLDARSGALIGHVEGIAGGTHGTGISHETGQGFTDDGRNGLAIAYDLKTLQIKKQIRADEDADGIVSDPATGHIFIIEGDSKKVTVIDPKTDAAVASIDVGEGLEYGASDGRGSIFIAGVEKRDLIRINVRTNAVTARWAVPDCQSPHGFALDTAHHRAFLGCVNSLMVVVDTDTGQVAAKLPIGKGNDAVAYDPKRRRVFSSNGRDGTISAYQEINPDRYELIETIPTAVSGRTMDVDPDTGRLFVPVAEVEPNTPPGQRPHYVPGSLKLMMFDPVR
jgi:YVTN family beta-propeller protein